MARSRNRQARYDAAVRRQATYHAWRPNDYAPVGEVLRAGDEGPECTCTIDPDGARNTNGCVVCDLPPCGFLAGEVAQ
ncbi:hypothetical protein AB0J14_04430 [Micromonospora arborensis]|uniref:hypothetical protein n=1 Tax=Micromonospora arborensis TaxID=2116518 RepID=UPI0033C48961